MSNPDYTEESSPVSASPPDKVTNSNIKERLNLHVKRRLQETTEAGGIQGSINVGNTKREKVCTSTTTGRGGKRSRGKHNSSVSSVPEDECSRDGNSSCNDGHKEKDNSPDILTMVLNEKKRSLLRDPEVKVFLDNIISILGL